MENNLDANDLSQYKLVVFPNPAQNNFTLTFNSEKDLADYQQNPDHKAFQTVLKPHMDKVFVVDYFVEPNK